jgi:hypothetical protein
MADRERPEGRAGLTAHILAERWPQLFHLTEQDAWEAIRREGLLSTTALLDRFQITGQRRDAIEASRRRESIRITHPAHGDAWIHDNRPINAAALSRTLVGMTEQEWYRELNRRVFFWLTRRRLERLLNAKLNRRRRLAVVVVDTRLLLEAYADRVERAHINTGAVRHTANFPRGAGTFRRINDYPLEERCRVAPREPIVELTVPYAIPDIERFVIEVYATESVRTVDASKPVHP